jgi:hypothetical protein
VEYTGSVEALLFWLWYMCASREIIELQLESEQIQKFCFWSWSVEAVFYSCGLVFRSEVFNTRGVMATLVRIRVVQTLDVCQTWTRRMAWRTAVTDVQTYGRFQTTSFGRNFSERCPK